MGDVYIPAGTGDDSEVVKRTDDTLDIDDLIGEYISLRAEVLAVPDLRKETADQETLDFWNLEYGNIREDELALLRVKARSLLERIMPIRDAGLLPDRYEDNYQRLVDFAL